MVHNYANGHDRKRQSKERVLSSRPSYVGGDGRSEILLPQFGKAGRTKICGGVRWCRVLS